MSLNIAVAGTVYNSNNEVVDAYIQCLYYNSTDKQWDTDIRSTEDGDYNLNLGDGSWLTQEPEIKINNEPTEYVLVSAWTTDNSERTGNHDEFAFYVFELDGSDTYINDIYLKPQESLDCSDWILPSPIISGNVLEPINNNTNEYTYTVDDKLYFHNRDYWDELIFDSLGTIKLEYNFDGSWTEDTTYITSDAGDLDVSIRVTDSYDNVSECTKTTKIYYDVTLCFNLSETEIYTDTDIHINSCITGNTDQINNILYDINQNDNTDNIDTNSTDPDVSITYTINEFGDIEITQTVEYFDGYDDVSKTYTQIFEMENIPPELILSVYKLEDENLIDITSEDNKTYPQQELIFKPIATDTDGTVEYIEYNVYKKTTDIYGIDTWILVFSSGKIDKNSDEFLEYTKLFDNELTGDLKLEVIAYDNLDATAIETYEFTILCAVETICTAVDIDWKSNKVNQLKFKTNINSLKFKINKKLLKFRINKEVLKFKINSNQLNFNINKILIKFKLNCR